MKRLLPSIILALGFHTIILSADFSWLKVAPPPALKSRSMAIVLSTVKSHPPRSEADFLRVKQLIPKENPAPDKMAEKKPEPAPNKKPIKNVETIYPASKDRRHSVLAAEAKTGSPPNPDTNSPVLPSSTATAWIKKTGSAPGGFSEPLTTAAAVPSTETKQIPSESQGVNIVGPRYKQNSPPGYPPSARRMGYEGLVLLKVLVGTNGRVDGLEVLQSSGYAVLDQAALSSVKKWVFEPGTEGGKKQKMWVKIPVRFELE